MYLISLYLAMSLLLTFGDPLQPYLQKKKYFRETSHMLNHVLYSCEYAFFFSLRLIHFTFEKKFGPTLY